MKKLRNVACFCTVAGAMAVAVTANAWVYTTSAQWGEWSGGGYTVYNDIWSGEGNQTLYVNSGSNWELISTNMTGGGVKAYGNSSYYPNYSNLNNPCTSSFQGSSAASAYDMSYDMWSQGNVDEIMLWEQWTSNVGPIGSEIASNVSVGGSTWNIYRGNTGHNVVSLLRTSHAYSGTNDIRAIMQYLNSKKWLTSASLYQVAFGYEITAASNAESYTSNFTVTL